MNPQEFDDAFPFSRSIEAITAVPNLEPWRAASWVQRVAWPIERARARWAVFGFDDALSYELRLAREKYIAAFVKVIGEEPLVGDILFPNPGGYWSAGFGYASVQYYIFTTGTAARVLAAGGALPEGGAEVSEALTNWLILAVWHLLVAEQAVKLSGLGACRARSIKADSNL